MVTRLAPTLVLVVLAWCATAEAQRPPVTAPAQPARPAPAAAAPAGPAATPRDVVPPPVTIPPPPTIDDPMLEPMPPAPVVVSGWEDALSYVRARSTDLRIAADEVVRAEGQSRVALGAALTQVNGNVAFTHQLITNTGAVASGISGTQVQFRRISTPNTDFFTGGVQIIQPIVAPRAWYAIGTARDREDAARISVEDTKRLIALNVASALVGVVTAERISELNRSGLRSALERHDLTRRKQALGAATGLDVVRAQQDAEVARATLVTGDESLRRAREALGLALGVPAQIGVTRDINLDGLERTAAGVCAPAKSIAERADIRRATKDVEVAARAVSDVKLQYLPTLNAQSSIATTTVDTGFTPTTTWNIQGILSIPIWDGGARYGAMTSARAVTDQIEQKLVGLKRTAEIEVVQARRGVEVAGASRKVAADARALAAETDRLVRTGYIEGQGTSLELVVAAAALRQADITLALREFELVRARVLAVLALSNCTW